MSCKLIVDCVENNYGQMMTRLEVEDSDPTDRERAAMRGLAKLLHFCMESMAVPTIYAKQSQQEVLKKAFQEIGIEI